MASRSRTGSALVLAAARASSLVGFLVATAVLSRALSPEDYATFRQGWILYQAIAPIVAIGLMQSLYYYLPRATPEAAWGIVRRTGLIALAAAVAIGVVAASARGPIAAAFSNPAAAPTFALFAAFIALSVPTQLSDGVFMPAERTGHAAIFNVLNRVLVLIALAVPVWLLGLSLQRALVLLVIAQAVLVCVMWWRSRVVHRMPVSESPVVRAREQIRFALPIAGASAFGAVFLQLDKVVAARMMAPEGFAVYSNGAFENPVIALLASASSAAVATELVRLHHARDSAGFVALWRAMFERLSLVALPMAAFMVAFAPEIVTLLFSSRYVDSAGVFRVYVLLTPIRIVGFSMLLMALGKNRLYLVGHVLACIGVIACAVPFARAFGILGPAIAMVVVSWVLAVAFLHRASRALSCRLAVLLPVRSLVTATLVAAAGAFLARLVTGALRVENVRALLVGAAVFMVLELAGGAAFGAISPFRARARLAADSDDR